MVALISTESGMFYNSMEGFLDPFNIDQLNKRIVFVDEISDATPKQSKRFHAICTCKIMKYNAKNVKHFSLETFAEIFTSSNDKVPIFLTSEDRRCAFLLASDIRKQDRKLFRKVYAYFEDFNTMYSWFMTLLNRDIGDWEPIPANDLDTQVRLDQKVSCMKPPWRFVAKFFSDENWPRKFNSYETWDYQVSRESKVGSCRTTVVEVSGRRGVEPRHF